MVDSNAKGSRGERELVNWLDDNEYAVLRAPASGSATTRELPDVLAGDGERFYAIEAKTSGDTVVYIDQEEVEDLQFFAEKFGAVPRLGVRFDEEHSDPSYGRDWPGWYFLPPERVYRTDGGNYRVKKVAALHDGIPLPQL